MFISKIKYLNPITNIIYDIMIYYIFSRFYHWLLTCYEKLSIAFIVKVIRLKILHLTFQIKVFHREILKIIR